MNTSWRKQARFLQNFYLKSIIDGGIMTITNIQLDKIKVLIGRIASHAGPELLGEVLAQLIRELTGGHFLSCIGIIVATD